MLSYPSAKEFNAVRAWFASPKLLAVEPMFSSAFESPKAGTVSYTHLDVYKRQEPHRTLRTHQTQHIALQNKKETLLTSPHYYLAIPQNSLSHIASATDCTLIVRCNARHNVSLRHFSTVPEQVATVSCGVTR